MGLGWSVLVPQHNVMTTDEAPKLRRDLELLARRDDLPQRQIRTARLLGRRCQRVERRGRDEDALDPIARKAAEATSKLSDVNWSTRAGEGAISFCQAIRLASGPWGIATPLGRPVEPEV